MGLGSCPREQVGDRSSTEIIITPPLFPRDVRQWRSSKRGPVLRKMRPSEKDFTLVRVQRELQRAEWRLPCFCVWRGVIQDSLRRTTTAAQKPSLTLRPVSNVRSIYDAANKDALSRARDFFSSLSLRTDVAGDSVLAVGLPGEPAYPSRRGFGSPLLAASILPQEQRRWRSSVRERAASEDFVSQVLQIPYSSWSALFRAGGQVVISIVAGEAESRVRLLDRFRAVAVWT